MVFWITPTSGIYSNAKTTQTGTNSKLSQQDFSLLLAKEMQSPDLSSLFSTESSSAFFNNSSLTTMMQAFNQTGVNTPYAELNSYKPLVGSNVEITTAGGITVKGEVSEVRLINNAVNLNINDTYYAVSTLKAIKK